MVELPIAYQNRMKKLLGDSYADYVKELENSPVKAFRVNTEKISLEDLAQKCFYNPSYFSRTFKQKFGLSPIEYITRERAKMAAGLLTNTTLSMDAIAEKCGYGDKSSLYRAFEKNYGCSPTDYRKQHNAK